MTGNGVFTVTGADGLAVPADVVVDVPVDEADADVGEVYVDGSEVRPRGWLGLVLTMPMPPPRAPLPPAPAAQANGKRDDVVELREGVSEWKEPEPVEAGLVLRCADRGEDRSWNSAG